ncbi:DUF45 domain-containing protein [Aurantiacibacter xanthus]|uniref:DUF45 domain-containing protein n=1 Tax=Aurantiacibacter xanthus TaxID=1784712 RepID=A0A3A1P513_9SPHN|nr:YgjP-like metallopeptidase domain-containing protein [Aurantiacibacter xanthus]RIV88342.1 DUF45 domain-containing protein [Aurantiacibacter xanthus]
MIDWLRNRQAHPLDDPQIEIAGRTLPLAIRRLKQARRLTMRLARDGSEVCITMPTWARTADALAFAQARHDWIAAQLAKAITPVAVNNGSTIAFRGDALRIAWDKAYPRNPMPDDGALLLGGPPERIEARVQRWLESEALRLAGDDLAFYCARAGEALPNLGLSRARRRWGSCSGDRQNGRTIRINWRLAMAPDFVRRSVVAHEVAHLAHFDHSPAFHAHLARLFEGDVHAADRWLKAEGPKLYAAFA